MIGIHTYTHTRTHTTDSLVVVWAFFSLCIWAMSNAKTQCSSWQIFICVFFLPNFTRTAKKWAFKIKALHCCSGASTHTVWHQYHRQFLFFFVSFVPFNFEVDRVARFCLHLHWAQHFRLFFFYAHRARRLHTHTHRRQRTFLCMRRATLIIIMTVINVDIFRYFIYMVMVMVHIIHKQCV